MLSWSQQQLVDKAQHGDQEFSSQMVVVRTLRTSRYLILLAAFAFCFRNTAAQDSVDVQVGSMIEKIQSEPSETQRADLAMRLSMFMLETVDPNPDVIPVDTIDALSRLLEDRSDGVRFYVCRCIAILWSGSDARCPQTPCSAEGAGIRRLSKSEREFDVCRQYFGDTYRVEGLRSYAGTRPAGTLRLSGPGANTAIGRVMRNNLTAQFWPAQSEAMMTRVGSQTIEQLLTPALLEAGYDHLGNLVYKDVHGSGGIERFIYMLYNLRGLNELSGAIGIRNDPAEKFSCETIRKYGGLLFQQFRPTTCINSVHFAKLNDAGWPVRLSNFTTEQSLRFLQDFLAREIVPTIGRVNNLDEFLELLVADKSYYPWPGSNGAIRAAQVVAVAGQIGLKEDFVRTMLEPRLQLIAAGLSKTSEMRANPKAYVERILDDWKSWSMSDERSELDP